MKSVPLWSIPSCLPKVRSNSQSPSCCRRDTAHSNSGPALCQDSVIKKCPLKEMSAKQFYLWHDNIMDQHYVRILKSKIVRKRRCPLCNFTFFLSALLRSCFLCWDRWNGEVTPTNDAALLCSSRVGFDLGRESGLDWRVQFHIVSDTCHPAPCYLNSDKVFLLLSNQYLNP